MSEFSPIPVSEIERRAALAEDALRPGNDLSAAGELYAVAQGALEEAVELSPREAGNVILPPRQQGEPKEARFQLAANAKDTVKAAALEHEAQIFARAEALDMKRTESIGDVDVARIDVARAILTVEAGANRTSVVRRQLAIDLAERLYGEHAAQAVIYQFGTDRAIPREKKGEPNPEYKVAVEIAGDFLPEDDTLTEFDLNKASALQAGYEIVADAPAGDSAERIAVLRKAGLPTMLLVKPYRVTGRLDDGFEAVSRLEGVNDRQFVIATNGQYRPKDEMQAEQWAQRAGTGMLPPVAIGDEPGYEVEHNGETLKTGNRAALAYAQEIVILERLHEPTRRSD